MFNYKITSNEVREYIKIYAEMNGRSIKDCVEDLNIMSGYDIDCDFGYQGSDCAASFMYEIIDYVRYLFNDEIDEIDLTYLFKDNCIPDLDDRLLYEKNNLEEYIKMWIQEKVNDMFQYYDRIEDYYYGIKEYQTELYEEEEEYEEYDDECVALRFVLHVMNWYLDKFYRKVALEEEFKQDVVAYINRLIELAENLDKNLNAGVEYYKNGNGREEYERCLCLGVRTPIDEINELINKTKGKIFQTITLDDNLKIIGTSNITIAEIYEKYCDKDVLENINIVEEDLER